MFYFSLMLAALISCKENDDNPNDDLQVVYDFLPMQTGNYWVYGHYKIDTLGNVFDEERADSVVITGDTLVNGKQYYVFEGTNYPYLAVWGIIDLLRDSSGYIVNDRGIIRFTDGNFDDILASKTEVISGDTIYTVEYRMKNPDSVITVPAGSFGVLNYCGTVETPQDIPGIANPRYMNNYYADEVGRVVETYFYLNNPNIYEKRLLRYKAEKSGF